MGCRFLPGQPVGDWRLEVQGDIRPRRRQSRLFGPLCSNGPANPGRRRRIDVIGNRLFGESCSTVAGIHGAVQRSLALTQDWNSYHVSLLRKHCQLPTTQ